MALIKNYQNENNGAQGNYWVASITYNNINKTLCISVDLFKDSDLRHNGKEPIDTKYFYYNTNDSITLTNCYNMLKQEDLFKDASDS